MLCGLTRGYMELGKAQLRWLAMIDRRVEGRAGSRHYSRWPNPWRPEDDWGPITAGTIFFIILVGLIVFGVTSILA
jgi:hypothetical protein